MSGTAVFVLASILHAAVAPMSMEADPTAFEAMRSDARLADVCFVDRQHGWAVGDRGTIWHTDNSGRTWHLQRSGVNCPLRSVWFADEQIGWAAGGFSHPYAQTSAGVLLFTRDGGRHWHHDPQLLMPALREVRFFGRKHGFAIGCASAMFPSGVFITDSGGRGWRPLGGEEMSPWLAGDFLDPNTGALAGRHGSLAMVRRGGIEPARTSSFGLRNLSRIRLAPTGPDEIRGWLIGDGGLVMTSADLGASWQTPPGELPREMARHFDFAALAVRGPKCWIAGSPGTRVFHSPDMGRTWRASATGMYVPIYALAFVDQQRGWAVGALGTILATGDGGQTWQRQRAGGTRAALLGLFGTGRHVPLELFAELSGNEGYLGVVELLGRRDVEIRPGGHKADPAERAHEALVAVGASDARTAWRFPLRQAGLGLGAREIIDGWDRSNDGRGLQELETYVVRQIRTWRPEVIVTHDASPRGDDPLGHLINQVVLRALQKAADPTSLPEQITHAALEPWKVKKVYAALPPGLRGSSNLTTAKLAARLGRSLADVAAMPRGLLEDRFAVAPPTLGFRLLQCRLPQPQGGGDFFSGIVLRPGGDARRQWIEPSPASLDQLRRIAQRQRDVQAILEHSGNDPRGGSQLLAQTDELTRGLDSEGAGRILYQLAQHYFHSGRWSLAAETFELLAGRYPDHPLSRPALLWLVQYYASGEVAVRSTDAPQQENRPALSAQFGKQAERTQPALFAEAALRFPLAVAHRNQGFPRQAERFYVAQARSPISEAWRACARGELWLAEPKGVCPKPVLHCVVAQTKPRLDGRLGDEVWQRGLRSSGHGNKASAAGWARLRSAQHDDADWPGVVMLAYDAEFLYLAVNCQKSPEARYQATNGPRPRDPDLSEHDRVEVFLDLDRDFATYFRLSVDHRGWTGDGCWGDRTWNPTWFVAAETSDKVWTVEAAIPLDQLAGHDPAPRHVWALGIQRTVPGVGFQSWSTPAAARVVPEGFGYLIFD